MKLLLAFVLLSVFAIHELEAGPLSFCCCCKEQESSCREQCPQPCRRRCQQPCQSPCQQQQQPCTDPCHPFPQPPPQPFPCQSGGAGGWPLWGPTGGGCGGRKKRDVQAVGDVRAPEGSQ